MNETMRIVRSSDNEHLMPLTGRRLIIGYVDEVNGPGAEEIPAFVPTRHELRQLAAYWDRELLEHQWFWFTCAQAGSDDSRRTAFARRRLARIGAVLGEEEMKQIVAETDRDFTKGFDEDALKLWDVFKHGDAEKYEALNGFENSLFFFHDELNAGKITQQEFGLVNTFDGLLTLGRIQNSTTYRPSTPAEEVIAAIAVKCDFRCVCSERRQA